ncbi:MAG: NAD-dependent epimerase/dehydratase family protein [Nibricoccus sp.]
MTGRKRILLLGGTGFIGTALTRRLSANRADNELMMLIHRKAPLRELEQINTHTGDLGTFDLALLDKFSPHVVVHLARMSGQGRIGRLLAAWRGARANRRIISHLQLMQPTPHVIYVSGTLVYGDCGTRPVDEDHPISPIAFAREYIRAEKPWMDALIKGTIPVTILRPPWIMGQGSWFSTFYLKSIHDHGIVPLFGDGQNWMSLIDVEDCAGLVAHAVRNAQPGRCYNLFCPNAHLTQIEFAERLSKESGASVNKLSMDEVKDVYSPTIWEAFTFSNISSTKYPEFIAGYDFKYNSIDKIIGNNLPADVSG